jgi:DNA-binding NarL/FixJ family response regulator
MKVSTVDTEVNTKSTVGGPSVPKGPAASRLPGREHELGLLSGQFAAVQRGRAASAILVGEFGMGKTATLMALADLAGEAGFTIALATGSRLETHLNGGVAAQLTDALTHVPDTTTNSPRPRQPHSTERLPAQPPETEYEQAEALAAFFRIIRRAAEHGPLLLGIDNVDMADEWSMRCLAYVRHRVAYLPVMVVLTSVIGYKPNGDVSLLEIAGCTPASIRLNGLGTAAVGRLLGTGSDELADVCREVTGGNPYLISGLRTRLVPGADPAKLGSAAVGQVLCSRVQEIPAAPELLRAVAILGADADFDLLPRLAGVDPLAALNAVDALVRLRVLTNSHLPEYSQVFVRNSVLAEIPVATRAAGHARAARLLADDGAPDARVAAHLLEATAMRIPWGVDVLRWTARSAVFGGEEALAARYLRRALEERLNPAKRLAVILQLAHAEYRCDPATPLPRVREAVEEVGDRQKVAYITTAMVLALCGGQDIELAVAMASQVSARLDVGGSDTAWPLLCMTYLAEAGTSLGPPPDFRDFERQWAPLTDPASERTRSALLALDAVRAGKSAEEAVRHFADVLSDDGSDLLFEQPYFFTLAAAVLADEPVRMDHLCRLLDLERDPWDAHLNRGTMATLARGITLQTCGDLARACAHYEFLLRQFDERDVINVCPIGLLCASRLIECYVDLGRLEAASALLEKIDFPGTEALFPHNYLLYARGRLRVAAGDTRLGLDDLLACGRRLQNHGLRFPGFAPWRAAAARAALTLGRTEQAARLAEDDLEAAERWGSPRLLGIAQTTMGLVREDDEAERLLQRAIETLNGSPARLHRAGAMTELGILQARRGRSAKAVSTLRQAIELSTLCEAAPLTRRASEELRTTLSGSSSFRDNEHGLTPQEARIATIAAQGLTNREIAEALHLTRRTVELHLSGAYRKLGITGRTELNAALARSQRVDVR